MSDTPEPRSAASVAHSGPPEALYEQAWRIYSLPEPLAGVAEMHEAIRTIVSDVWHYRDAEVAELCADLDARDDQLGSMKLTADAYRQAADDNSAKCDQLAAEVERLRGAIDRIHAYANLHEAEGKSGDAPWLPEVLRGLIRGDRRG